VQGDLSATGGDSQATVQVGEEGRVVLAQQELMSYEAAEADNSLLTFEEEDVEFDPLKRSDSLASRSDSISKRPPPTTTTAAALTNRATLEKGFELSATLDQPKPAPLNSRESLDHIQDLTGIDLTTPSTAPQMRQDGVGLGSEMLHPFQGSSATSTALPINLVMASSAGMMPHPQGGGVQMVAAPMGGQGQVPLGLQGGVAYGGVAQGGLGYGGGGPAMMPVVYAAQGNTGMMYQVSNLVM
jgi:hypothetical protein